MTEEVVRLENVRFAYPRREPVLRGVDLAVAPGEFVLVVGASGSGKSTLLRCLNGLVPHFHGGEIEGRVLVAGRDVREHPPAVMFDRVGLVPQNPAGALFSATVEDEIAYGLESLGTPAPDILPRARAAAASVGLTELLERPPHALSGGEQQRLLVAAALAVRPAVLALDEPFAHLDPEMAEELSSILLRLASAGVTVIVAEHRLGTLIGNVHRLVVLDDGRVACDGPPSSVLACDLPALGVNVPLPTRLGAAAGLDPPALDLESLLARLPPEQIALDGRGLGQARDPKAGAAVEFEGVTAIVGDEPVLVDLSASIAEGEVAALLGRNGAGKTTLLKHVIGLQRPRRGEVRVRGRSSAGRPVSALAREVGLVFQNPNDQFFQPTVRAELETGPAALGMRDPEWLEDLIERFDLGPLLERSPFRLSEGQKKRVTFAAALAARPSVVLLDEPTTGQDERFRAELVRLVSEIAAEGRAVVLATHDVELADETAERWLVLDEGQIVADGTPGDVMLDVEAFRASGLRPAGATWVRAVLSLGRPRA